MNNEPNFNTFDEIQHKPLQIFNRTVMLSNIHSDLGKEKVAEYIENFTQAERKQMFIMQNFIKKFGYKKAKDLCTSNVQFEDVEIDQEQPVA